MQKGKVGSFFVYFSQIHQILPKAKPHSSFYTLPQSPSPLLLLFLLQNKLILSIQGTSSHSTFSFYMIIYLLFTFFFSLLISNDFVFDENLCCILLSVSANALKHSFLGSDYCSVSFIIIFIFFNFCFLIFQSYRVKIGSRKLYWIN